MPDNVIDNPLTGPTAFIHLKAIQHNATLAKTLAPHAKLLSIIKANAYGHGAIQVAQCLAAISDGFGVARLEEGIELREAQVNLPIIVMSPVLHNCDMRTYAKYKLTPILSNTHHFAEMANRCAALQLGYWLKIDTGMHRLGLNSNCLKEASSNNTLEAIRQSEVLITHFKSAESNQRDDQQQQYEYLQEVEAFCQQNAIALSASNSANLLFDTNDAIKAQHLQNENWVRPGIMLYGADPLESPNSNSCQLQSAMTFKAPIIDIKAVTAGESIGYNGLWTATQDSLIATVAAGYADGYPRQLPSNTPVLIHGQRAHLVGRVSMDMISVDISHIKQAVKMGDAVTLWGENLHAEEIAACGKTISYELFTGISPRVKRVYL